MARKPSSKDRAAEARALARECAPEVIRHLLSIVGDPHAPAPARATSGTTVLRVCGFFEKADDSEGKQLHEKSAAELDAMIEEAEQRLKALGPIDAGDNDEASVFD